MIQQVSHYQIKGLLGQGGMGVVYRADDPRLFGEVAVKILRLTEPDPFLSQEEQRKEALKQQQAWQRFEREAKVVARLQHVAIVPVYDFGRVQVRGLEYPFMVMRLMKGGSLEKRLQQGALPLDEVVRIVERLATGLDKVHGKGIVHRDLKPANILFDEDGWAYLADFGIAKLLDAKTLLSQSTSIHLTQSRAMPGTPAYMSPEQTYTKAHRKVKLDGRSDIYALGAIVYEMLTGKRPYHEAMDLPQIMYAHRYLPVPRLDEFRTDLGAGWQAVIDQAMAKEPDERYATAGALAAALKPLISTSPAPVVTLPTAATHLEAGNRYYQQGNYDAAIAEYSRALLLDVNSSPGYLYRGVVYHIKGQFDKAIPDYNQAIRLNPNDPNSYHYRGLAYYNIGQLSQAIRDYDHALRLKPDYNEAANNRQAAVKALMALIKDEARLKNLPPKQRVATYLALFNNPSLLASLPPTRRAAFGVDLANLGDPRKEIMTVEGMLFCYVPPGAFWMGSNEGRDDNKPLHQLDIPYGYWISRDLISNAQFQQFIDAGGYRTERYWAEAKAAGVWKNGQVKGLLDRDWRSAPYDWGEPFTLPNHPVVGVNWYEALAFTRWLTERLGSQMGLPSEAEWEKAARGGLMIPATPLIRPASALSVPQGLTMMSNPLPQRRYPWGDEVEAAYINSEKAGIGTTSALGVFHKDQSPYGCQEMGGNVYEWTRSLYQSYPYLLDGKREELSAPKSEFRVFRGIGSFYNSTISVGFSLRHWLGPDDEHFWGIRVFRLPNL